MLLEIVECIDCEKKVSKWYTTDHDERPRCEKCAVIEYKSRNPYWWVQIRTNVGIITDIP